MTKEKLLKLLKELDDNIYSKLPSMSMDDCKLYDYRRQLLTRLIGEIVQNEAYEQQQKELQKSIKQLKKSK